MEMPGSRSSVWRRQHERLASSKLAPGSTRPRSLAISSSTATSMRARWSWSTRPGWRRVRDLARVVDQVTRVGAKLILAGDHRQLPEVAAGGGFRAALDVLGNRVVELTVNRRQQATWERAALDQLRHGDVVAAFAAYQSHGRVVLDDDRVALRQRAIADWNGLRTEGATLMLAGTRAEALQLNLLARRVLAEAGELALDRAVVIGGRSYAPGEHVILRRNHRGQHMADGTEFAVDNGMRGQLTHIDAAGAHVTLATGEEIVLDRDYLAAGWLDYGYASTVHTAQGVTCDYVLVVGPAGLYREAVYVAMSRARLVRLDLRHHHRGTRPRRPPRHRHPAARRTRPRPRTRADRPSPRLRREAARLVSGRRGGTHRRSRRSGPGRHAARPGAARRDTPSGSPSREGHTNPADLRVDLDRAVTFRAHAEIGRRVRALDRDNVGHVIALDDTDATCDVLFVNDQGRSATRTMAWSELVVIDQPEPTALTEESVATLERITDDVERAARGWASALASHGVEPGDADRFQRAASVACDRAAHRLRADPPEWLDELARPAADRRTGSRRAGTTPSPASHVTEPSTRSTTPRRGSAHSHPTRRRRNVGTS